MFVSPPPAGRRITVGFTYLQKLGRPASYDVWFPPDLHRDVQALLAAGQTPDASYFPVQWAAVRQFELLQELGNYKIYDMKAMELERSLWDLSKNMKASGYRVTVMTLGDYTDNPDSDDLQIFDRRLQDRIARLVNMLYMEEESENTNAEMAKTIREGRWKLHTALPHVAMTLGAGTLFNPQRQDRQTRLAQRFFDMMDLIPPTHILHDTALGLQLPEAIKEHEQVYLAPGDLTLAVFNTLLCDLFTPFDGLSLSGLHERGTAHREIKASHQHMRHCDHMTESGAKFYSDAACVVH